MNKQEFFYKPKTAREILMNRDVRRESGNIAERVLCMRENEALIIPEIVPEDYEGRMRFLKRAPQVVLDTGKTAWDAMRSCNTPLKARRKAFNNLDRDEKYCGFAWKSLRKNEHKRASLVECIEGAKLFAWTELANAEIKITPYNNAGDAAYFGGKFKVKVSSRTPKQPRYELTLESVPIVASRQNPVVWTDITSAHYCGITGNDFSYRYVSSEDFCAHVIAAYLEIAREKRLDRGNLVPLEFVPFALPSEMAVGFYNRLTNSMMVEQAVDGKKRKRPLNKAEKEILLWDLVKIMGHDTTFYATKKFKEYDWANAA